MPKPVPDAPARYRAFLSALRRTANAELAFRQSGVNRSWAYWRRKRDADFARDWAAALAAGAEFDRQIGPLQRHFEANSRDFRDLCYARRVNQKWCALAHGLRSGNNGGRTDETHLPLGETNMFTTRSTRVDHSAVQIAPSSIEVAMIRFFKALAPAALLAVAGCAAPFQAQVSRFQQLPAPQGQTFAVVADNPRLDGSLEFGQYANTVAQRLAGYGYTRAVAPGDANLVVRLDYGVDKGRDRLRTVPGFGPGGFGGGYGPRFGYSNGWGPYRPYWGFGRRAWIYGYDDPFLYGSRYDEVESYTVYQSELTMKIERKGSRERVFEGTAKAMSSDNDLTTLVPNLIEAMFTGFPGNSGQTVKITVAPPERQRR